MQDIKWYCLRGGKDSSIKLKISQSRVTEQPFPVHHDFPSTSPSPNVTSCLAHVQTFTPPSQTPSTLYKYYIKDNMESAKVPVKLVKVTRVLGRTGMQDPMSIRAQAHRPFLGKESAWGEEGG